MNSKAQKLLDLIEYFIYNRVIALVKPIDEKKILFASEAQSELKGNLLAVYNEIKDNHPEYSCVVRVKGDRRDSLSITEKRATWKDFSTAKYVFLDDFYGITSAMKVRKGQELIQLWHACGAYKKFGFSRINTGDHITTVNGGYRKYTKVSVTSDAIRSCYAEAFGLSEDKVEALGSPRTDIFFDECAKQLAKEHVMAKYPELEDKKVILIAPTYRGRKVQDANYDFDKLKLDQMVTDLGKEYAIVVKWHPALYNNIKKGIIEDYRLPKPIIDASDYSEFNELMIAADILVTDYSSIIFEWALMNKPIIYYTYDENEYEGSRGLYFDFDEYVYGPCVTDYESLIEVIKNPEFVGESKNIKEKFIEKFMAAADGNSTKRIVERIIGKQERN